MTINSDTRRITLAQVPLLACFLFLCSLVLFISLGDIPLSGRSEGRYASTSMAMADSNNWLVPEFMGKPHLTKPPLTYWLQAACLKTIGHGELAVRLPSAVAGLGTVVLVFLLARRIGGTLTGVTAAGTLAVMPMHVVISRLTLTDGLLGFFWFAALAAGYLAIQEPAKKRWPILMWTAVGLGALTKAHLALVPVGLLLLWLGVGGRWKEKSALRVAIGLPLACLPLIAWVVAILMRYPDAGKVWWHEIVNRLTGGAPLTDSSLHYKPFYYFVPVFIAGLLPATAMLMLPGLNLSWKSAWSKLRRGEDAALWALAVVVPFVIFSINKGKLASYLLPLAPPLAILTGLMLSSWLRGEYDKPVIGRDAFGNRPTKPAEVRGALLALSIAAAVVIGGAFWLPLKTVSQLVGYKPRPVAAAASVPITAPTTAPTAASTTAPTTLPATQPANAPAVPPSAASASPSDAKVSDNAITLMFSLALLRQNMPWLPFIPVLAAISALWLFAAWGTPNKARNVPPYRRAAPLACLWLVTIFGWVGSLQVYRLLGSLSRNADMIADIEVLTNLTKPKLVTLGFRDATLSFYLRDIVPFKGTAADLDEWIMAYPDEAVIIVEAEGWDAWVARNPTIAAKLEELRRWQQKPMPSERIILRPRAGLTPTTRPVGVPSAELPDDDN